jgi:hypothetical protein
MVTRMRPLLTLALTEPGRVAADADDPFAAAWYADADAAASDAVAARNRAIATRLATALPGLAAATTEDDTADAMQPGLGAEQMIRRYHRRLRLAGPAGALGVELVLFDGLALLTLALPEEAAADPGRLRAAMSAVVGAVMDATGFLPAGEAGRDAGATVDRLLLRHGPAIREGARRAARLRLQARLGLPAAALLGLLALAASGLLLAEALRLGGGLATADTARPLAFTVTEIPAPERWLGVVPRHVLLGRVAGEAAPVRLPVPRDAVLRAGPGARYTVVPTHSAATPYLLLTELETAGPVWAPGGVGLALVPAGLALLPLVLWAGLVAWPLRGAPEPWRRAKVTQLAAWLLAGLAAAALAGRFAA